MFRHARAIFRLGGRSSLAVACVIVSAAVALPLTTGDATIQAWVPTVGLIAYALFLAAAALVYFHWRQLTATHVDSIADVGFDRMLGWLAILLLVVSVPALLLPSVTSSSSWLLLSQIIVAMVLVVFTRVSRRLDLVADPAALGLAIGMTVTSAGTAGHALAPSFQPGLIPTLALCGVLVVGGLALARDLLKHPLVPTWARQRLAVCVIALVAAQSAEHVDGLFAAEVALVGYLTAAAVISSTALRLQGRALEEYEVEVHQMQQEVAEQRELLHELGATLAGIASASELIRQHDQLPEPRRQRLEQMMGSEVARMVRLMSDRAQASEVVEVEVDEVVGPVVVSHQARGRDVRWNDSYLTLAGRADDVAEIVNILLENAARHAGSAPVVLTATGPTDNGMVEIGCADLGPGVPRDMRSKLFDVGVRRAGSPGQGLGLAIAHRLATDLGGGLDLRPSARGANFVVRLPVRTATMRTTDVVAQAS